MSVLTHVISALAAALLSGLASMAAAQATLHDPLPLQGNQAESIAATAAMNGTNGRGAGQGKTSEAEFIRRKQHTAEAAACRDQAREQHPRGSPGLKAARERCSNTLKAQKATWYRPGLQAR